jgi:hypothetical protein
MGHVATRVCVIRVFPLKRVEVEDTNTPRVRIHIVPVGLCITHEVESSKAEEMAAHGDAGVAGSLTAILVAHPGPHEARKTESVNSLDLRGAEIRVRAAVNETTAEKALADTFYNLLPVADSHLK